MLKNKTSQTIYDRLDWLLKELEIKIEKAKSKDPEDIKELTELCRLCIKSFTPVYMRTENGFVKEFLGHLLQIVNQYLLL